jgi:hypothetical protein
VKYRINSSRLISRKPRSPDNSSSENTSRVDTKPPTCERDHTIGHTLTSPTRPGVVFAPDGPDTPIRLTVSTNVRVPSYLSPACPVCRKLAHPPVLRRRRRTTIRHCDASPLDRIRLSRSRFQHYTWIIAVMYERVLDIATYIAAQYHSMTYQRHAMDPHVITCFTEHSKRLRSMTQ